MADDALSDEISGLVSDAQADADDSDESPEAEAPKKPRVKKRTSRKKDEKARTVEEIDRDELLPTEMPKPAQNIKGLGDMYAKYGIGERPDFKLHLYRTYPKIAPGGIKFDGFYDEYDIPLLEQQIQADYGGGQYRITVVGPHPTNPRLPKNYESHPISLAGNPNYDRMPRALQKPDKQDVSGATNANPPPMPVAMPENPKIVEAALKMFDRQSEADRAERRRQEEKFEEKIARAQSGSSAVADAERRRADDLIAAERERSNSERSYLEKRMDEMKREQEEQQRRMEDQLRSRPSMAEELRSLAPLFQKDDSATKEILTQILQKHRDEISQMQTQHAEFVRDVRQSHQTELQALRQSHQREIEAERQASRGREERIEERLRSERDERERDRQRHKESMDERDRHWKDRMDQSLQMQNQSWESRHQAQVSTYENRIQWLQQEIDKLNSEIRDLKSKQEDKGDIFQQLTKYREFQTVIKDFGGGESSSSAQASGGIGLSGGGDDWKATLAEGLSERAPQIFERLFSAGGAAAQVQQPPQQQMQEYKEGQIVDTPQGKMEVVRNPADGQLALAPKEALDAHRAQVQQQQRGGGILGPGPQQQRRRRPAPRREERRRSQGPSAVPDLREGLPRPVPPWEGGTAPHQAPEPPAPPPPMPRSATRAPKPTQSAPLELSHQERQGLQILAKEVHESVQRADEPEEFVEKMLQKYPAQLIQQIVGRYTDNQIAQGIQQIEPHSAGATPAGNSFVRQAFALVRKALQ